MDWALALSFSRTVSSITGYKQTNKQANRHLHWILAKSSSDMRVRLNERTNKNRQKTNGTTWDFDERQAKAPE